MTLDFGSAISRSAVADQVGTTRFAFQSGRVELQASGPISKPLPKVIASRSTNSGARLRTRSREHSVKPKGAIFAQRRPGPR